MYAVLTLLLSLTLTRVNSLNHANNDDSTNNTTELLIDTSFGPVRGTLSFSNKNVPVRVWRGIPYASPPVGPLRFSPPLPPKPWTKPLDCTSSKLFCAQSLVGKEIVGSEDCLYLDVYSPLHATEDSRLPVMVWIYGGAYSTGDDLEFGLYDATNLVAKYNNHVHVAMNYRLWSLGFLALPGLRKEHNTTGNQGVQDQQQALYFVKQNIAAFGGDPEKVVLFGESAGAISICWHLANPISRTKNLFQGVIMESGNCETPAFFVPLDDAESFGEFYATQVGCNASAYSEEQLVECMRALPLKQIFHNGYGKKRTLLPPPKGSGSQFVPLLYPIMSFGPAIDGSVFGLPDLPWNLIKEGKFHRVPVMLGSNANEGNLFVSLMSKVTNISFPFSSVAVQAILDHFFNTTASQQVFKMYQNASEPDWESVTALLLRDFFFACPARRVARVLSAQHRSAYLYSFTFNVENWIDHWILGDYHSSEIEFVFDNPWPPIVHRFNTMDEKMSDIFNGYWTNFAHSLDPNVGPTKGLSPWPLYSDPLNPSMNMTVPNFVEYHYLEEICDFWDRIQPKQGRSVRI